MPIPSHTPIADAWPLSAITSGASWCLSGNRRSVSAGLAIEQARQFVGALHLGHTGLCRAISLKSQGVEQRIVSEATTAAMLSLDEAARALAALAGSRIVTELPLLERTRQAFEAYLVSAREAADFVATEAFVAAMYMNGADRRFHDAQANATGDRRRARRPPRVQRSGRGRGARRRLRSDRHRHRPRHPAVAGGGGEFCAHVRGPGERGRGDHGGQCQAAPRLWPPRAAVGRADLDRAAARDGAGRRRTGKPRQVAVPRQHEP